MTTKKQTKINISKYERKTVPPVAEFTTYLWNVILNGKHVVVSGIYETVDDFWCIKNDIAERLGDSIKALVNNGDIEPHLLPVKYNDLDFELDVCRELIDPIDEHSQNDFMVQPNNIMMVDRTNNSKYKCDGEVCFSIQIQALENYAQRNMIIADVDKKFELGLYELRIELEDTFDVHGPMADLAWNKTYAKVKSKNQVTAANICKEYEIVAEFIGEVAGCMPTA